MREAAGGLLGVVDETHLDPPCLRVRGKVFASVPDATHLELMLAPDDIARAVSAHPRAVTELWRRKRLSGVTVNLELAARQVVVDLLEQAWRARAPKMLVHELDGRRGNDELEPVLAVMRTWPELVSKGRANFHVNGRAFLHFHQSRTARHADVREGRSWGTPIVLPVGVLPKKVEREFLQEVRRRLDVTLSS